MSQPFFHDPVLERKFRDAEAFLSALPPVAVAWSGGADSTFLAWLLETVTGRKPLVILAVTPLLGKRERSAALDVARLTGFRVIEVPVDPLAIPEVRENSRRRCYYCKKAVMTAVQRAAQGEGATVVADGSHAEDDGKYRPGKEALRELGILSPLASAGFVKSEIREMSRQAGLPTWNKPSQSCFATRIPYGTELTVAHLVAVEEAEAILHSLGCLSVRVRLHGDLARIEMDPAHFPLLLDNTVRETVLRGFRRLGLERITLDLEGYRSGSWD